MEQLITFLAYRHQVNRVY